jgi:hypothetical protein
MTMFPRPYMIWKTSQVPKFVPVPGRNAIS